MYKFQIRKQWPPYEKLLLTRLIVCLLFAFVFPASGFWVELVLIAPVPGHCLRLPFYSKGIDKARDRKLVVVNPSNIQFELFSIMCAKPIFIVAL